MQPTEIFTETVKTGISPNVETKPVKTVHPKSESLEARDVIRVDIKLLLHWASKQLDQCSDKTEIKH